MLPRPSPQGLTFPKPSKCQKHLAKMCDIRTMISRALAGDSSVYSRGVYTDVSNQPNELQDCLNALNRGREAYYNLPEQVRAVYPSPEVFMAALADKSEHDRLLKLGILEKVRKDAPVEVRVIADATEPSKGDAPSNT